MFSKKSLLLFVHVNLLLLFGTSRGLDVILLFFFFLLLLNIKNEFTKNAKEKLEAFIPCLLFC